MVLGSVFETLCLISETAMSMRSFALFRYSSLMEIAQKINPFWLHYVETVNVDLYVERAYV